ncbi:RNA polymerase sigma factor SigJ [Streptomyces sp. NBC_00841]|uniref:RNA polymerase sigma factor SigJ n=1 Tax=Streptomyces sp. NBC_01669 TaxID=2975909 RepID=UPI002255862C|nr:MULTISPECIES: RNA polymerase sigma factor SigJ [unclassified Streptomyces]MCX4531769.1 RNA polymerase sigma factor SigJ [Streptomyces sp. NBC_01669]WSA04601.1 RNA polymerase sigma factor SigJ [Streptomyces sp. NBC_00841]
MPEGSPRETASDPVANTATQVFNDHRELLFSIVYNMLGSVADTEDVLQETWLSWTTRNQAPSAERIDNPRAYLVRIAVNRALAHQATISRRRETYIGPWLPEPLVSPLTDTLLPDDAADATVRAESVSMALLVILETLTPLERGVFVLHEVFGYAHTEIAEILGRSPSAIRQLAHRAREHVHARRPRYEPDPHVRQQVTEQFLAAALGGDLDALLQILAPEVTLWGDGGGKAAGGLRPLRGREKVARLLAAVAPHSGKGLNIAYRSVNGAPSALLFVGDTPYAVLVLDLTPDGNQVCGIYAVANPDKLSHVD